jgi:hypothetical protein
LFVGSLVAAGVVLCSAAEADVPPPFWQADVFLAASGAVPENAGGLIVIVTVWGGGNGPAVPTDVNLLSPAERAALAGEIAEYGQLGVVDSLGQPRATDLQLYDRALWLAFALEPGSYTFVSQRYEADFVEAHETPFVVTPAVAFPASAGAIETFIECDQGSACDTTQDLTKGARVVYSAEASPFASVMLHRWWPSPPPYLGDPFAPPGPPVWSAWQPGGVVGSWTRSCLAGVSYWAQIEEGTHDVFAGTVIAGAWLELPHVESTLTVSCDDCAWDPLPPECSGSGAGSSSGGSGGAANAGSSPLGESGGCDCSTPRDRTGRQGWVPLMLVLSAGARTRRRSAPPCASALEEER